jgi:hypothetical protein
MADPVSWLLIEPGWKVVATDGVEIGRVEEVLGDSNADIFDGLSISSGLFARPRYIPAEEVGEIVEGTVHLTIDRAAAEQHGEFKEPPVQEQISSEGSSRLERVEHALAPPVERSERVGLVRRALEWLGLAGRR